MKAYKFRLYPNKEQEEKLDFALDTCRQAYNILLEELNQQVVIDKNMIQATLPDLKICEPRFKEVYSKTLQYECYRLFSNLSALRVLKSNKRKVGRLRFKGKGWFKTINYNQSGFELVKTNNRYDKLHLSKIGDIKILVHREVIGNIKQVTIKKSLGKWYASLVSDAKIGMICGDKVLGIDLGINSFIVDSENNRVANPLNYNKHLVLLKEAHRNLSRKKRGSNNGLKSKIHLNKLYEKINNCRYDFLHKTSTDMIKKSKILCVEKLNIKKMMEQKYYNAKNMADSSFGEFVNLLTYKAESAGCKLIMIDPKNTTKMCSNCKSIKEMKLYERTYECPECGLVLDRDYNSAINILNKGLVRANVENNSSVIEELSEKQEAISLT